MSQTDVDQIKERLSIEEVVGSYIKLDRAGKNLKARCPFHNEKTPSFTLSPDRDNYYCFGCHASGDIFSFVQEFEGITFRESLEKLADKAGVVLSNTSDKDFAEKNKLYGLLETTNEYFEEQLVKNTKALDYLKTRGLTDETIKEWRIGFAPDGWRNLKEYLVAKKFSEQDIEKAGLIKKNEKGDSYDRFRSRIIFPINDGNGRPVGFTGRIFGGKDDDAKYLNSPETLLFEKSKILHGFDKAKSFIRKFDFSILVEGQMDLIMAHQAGYKNTVASSGTALTEEHLRLLSKISDKIVVAYDSDNAGFRASEKVWKMALQTGMDVKIAPIESGKDPADVILESADEWKTIIKDSKHIIEIITNRIKISEQDHRKKGKAVSTILIPYLKSIGSSIDQEHFIGKVSVDLGISEESIRKEMSNSKIEEKYSFSEPSAIDMNSDPEPELLLANSEREFFGLLFWQQSLSENDRKVNVIKLEKRIKDIYDDKLDRVLEEANKFKDQLIFESEKIYTDESDPEKMQGKIDDLTSNLENKFLLKKRHSLRQKIIIAEREKDSVLINEILAQIQEISKRINDK
jgi:DNA primase